MSDDYYSSVYTWFEKCGIIANVRTHLRQNLVNALRNKNLSLSDETNKPKCAKQYVYDLLIAEYLWSNNYVYSLSVFASEVPLLLDFQGAKEKSASRQKLRNDYISHTLETLGIKANDRVGKCITEDYINSDHSLLLSILKYITQLDSTSRDSTKCNQPQKHFAHAQVQTDQGYDDKLSAARRKLLQQKREIEDKLKQKEREMKDQMKFIEQQLLVLQEKVDEAQKLTANIDTKERQLREDKRRTEQKIFKKETELKLKENFLTQEGDRLKKERDSYKQFENDLKKLQDELVKVKRELPRAEEVQRRFKDAEVQTITCEPDKNERLQESQEREELLNLVHEQQARIQQLTFKAVQVTRQLEEVELFKVPSVPPRVANATIISESSSTEDILQDAKKRLMRLEEESLRVERNYFNCITIP